MLMSGDCLRDCRLHAVFLSVQGRKKKFIDKKESSTFHVVHRSQQDKAAVVEEGASEFVLIPSGVSKFGIIWH